MLGIIWISIVGISLVFGAVSGRLPDVGNAVFASCGNCIEFMVTTGGFMIMWSGFMNVAEKSGLSSNISRVMSPFITRVFKGVKKGTEEVRLISANISANMLGLSNAATPLGMAAMKKLGEKSRNGTATDDMCMLAVINCASLQLVPSTLIALRSSYGSVSPGDITIPVWITSVITLAFAICITKISERKGNSYLST